MVDRTRYPFLIGSKLLDESAIADTKVLTYDAASGRVVYAAGGGGGAGDMTKAVYDTNDDGTVDAADYATDAGDADTVDGKDAADFQLVANVPPVVLRLATDGSISHDVGAPLVLGQFALDASDYSGGGTGWVFRATLWCSGPGADGTITARCWLHNLTDDEAVTDADVDTTDDECVLEVSAALTVGSDPGDLQDTLKTYEVRLEVQAGTDDTDTALLGAGELVYE